MAGENGRFRALDFLCPALRTSRAGGRAGRKRPGHARAKSTPRRWLKLIPRPQQMPRCPPHPRPRKRSTDLRCPSGHGRKLGGQAPATARADVWLGSRNTCRSSGYCRGHHLLAGSQVECGSAVVMGPPGSPSAAASVSCSLPPCLDSVSGGRVCHLPQPHHGPVH